MFVFSSKLENDIFLELGAMDQKAAGPKQCAKASQGRKEHIDCYIHALPVELLREILTCGHQGADTSPDARWLIMNYAAPPTNEKKAAFATHLLICRLVCKQWRDCLPPPFLGFLFSFGPTVAAEGSISLLQWAKEEMIQWYAWDGSRCCEVAIKGGHLELLKWLMKNDEDGWNHGKSCAWAAEEGHLDVLKWLRENRCTWNEETCTAAARGGHLDLLKWLRENYCPWDRLAGSVAAEGGHLEMLIWARGNGCPVDSGTCDRAAAGGHLPILKWLKEIGCPIAEPNGYPCASAAQGGHLMEHRSCESSLFLGRP